MIIFDRLLTKAPGKTDNLEEDHKQQCNPRSTVSVDQCEPMGAGVSDHGYADQEEEETSDQ